ncbi:MULTISPECIES: hypothetical protein [unclassified Pseudoalteromonas]
MANKEKSTFSFIHHKLDKSSNENAMRLSNIIIILSLDVPSTLNLAMKHS